MRSKFSTLVALAAGVLVGQFAVAQSEDMSPPRSTGEDMPAQQGQDTFPGDTSTGNDATSPRDSGQTQGDMTGSTTGEAAGPMGAGQIDQKKVEQFADAYVQVQTIQQQANADIEAATDPMQADQVKTAAQSDMIKAVERSGLQVEEFNQIVASMAADNELRSRVSAEVQKRINQGTPGAGT